MVTIPFCVFVLASSFFLPAAICSYVRCNTVHLGITFCALIRCSHFDTLRLLPVELHQPQLQPFLRETQINTFTRHACIVHKTIISNKSQAKQTFSNVLKVLDEKRDDTFRYMRLNTGRSRITKTLLSLTFISSTTSGIGATSWCLIGQHYK